MLRLPQLELQGLPNGCEIQSIAVGKGLAFAVAASSDGSVYGLGDNRSGALALEPPEIEHADNTAGVSSLVSPASDGGGDFRKPSWQPSYAQCNQPYERCGAPPMVTTFTRLPLLGPGLSKHRASVVSCGLAHCAILTQDGRLFTAGYASHGRLGRPLPWSDSISKSGGPGPPGSATSSQASRRLDREWHHPDAWLPLGEVVAGRWADPRLAAGEVALCDAGGRKPRWPLPQKPWTAGAGKQARIGDGCGKPTGFVAWVSVSCGDRYTVALAEAKGSEEDWARSEGLVAAEHEHGDAASAESGGVPHGSSDHTTGPGDGGGSGSGSGAPKGRGGGAESAVGKARVAARNVPPRLAFAWGDGARGRLGTGDEGGSEVPLPLWTLLRKRARRRWGHVTQVSCGRSHSLALAAKGAVVTWGDSGGDGRLGLGRGEAAHTPQEVQGGGLGGRPAIQLSAGDKHSLCLDSEGLVWAWGCSADGRLGIVGQDTSEDVLWPVCASRQSGWPLTGVKARTISAGGKHSCCVDDIGRLWVWGASDCFGLSPGKTDPLALPVHVESDITAPRLVSVDPLPTGLPDMHDDAPRSMVGHASALAPPPSIMHGSQASPRTGAAATQRHSGAGPSEAASVASSAHSRARHGIAARSARGDASVAGSVAGSRAGSRSGVRSVAASSIGRHRAGSTVRSVARGGGSSVGRSSYEGGTGASSGYASGHRELGGSSARMVRGGGHVVHALCAASCVVVCVSSVRPEDHSEKESQSNGRSSGLGALNEDGRAAGFVPDSALATAAGGAGRRKQPANVRGLFASKREDKEETQARTDAIVLDLRADVASSAGVTGPQDETAAPDQTLRFRRLMQEEAPRQPPRTELSLRRDRHAVAAAVIVDENADEEDRVQRAANAIGKHRLRQVAKGTTPGTGKGTGATGAKHRRSVPVRSPLRVKATLSASKSSPRGGIMGSSAGAFPLGRSSHKAPAARALMTRTRVRGLPLESGGGVAGHQPAHPYSTSTGFRRELLRSGLDADHEAMGKEMVHVQMRQAKLTKGKERRERLHAGVVDDTGSVSSSDSDHDTEIDRMMAAESDAARRHRRLQQQLRAMAGHRWQSSLVALKLRREELEEAKARIRRGVRRQQKEPWAAAVDQMRAGGKRRPAAFRWDAPGDGQPRRVRVLPTGAVQELPGSTAGAGGGAERNILPRFQYQKKWALRKQQSYSGADAKESSISKSDVVSAGLFSATDAQQSAADDGWRQRSSAREEAQRLLGVSFGPAHHDVFPGAYKNLVDAREQLGSPVPRMHLHSSSTGSRAGNGKVSLRRGNDPGQMHASTEPQSARARLQQYSASDSASLSPVPPGSRHRRPVRRARPGGAARLVHQGSTGMSEGQGVPLSARTMRAAPPVARAVLQDEDGGVLGLAPGMVPLEARAGPVQRGGGPGHMHALVAQEAAVLRDQAEYLQWQHQNRASVVQYQRSNADALKEPTGASSPPGTPVGRGDYSAEAARAASRNHVAVGASWSRGGSRFAGSAGIRTRGILLARDASLNSLLSDTSYLGAPAVDLTRSQRQRAAAAAGSLAAAEAVATEIRRSEGGAVALSSPRGSGDPDRKQSEALAARAEQVLRMRTADERLRAATGVGGVQGLQAAREHMEGRGGEASRVSVGDTSEPSQPLFYPLQDHRLDAIASKAAADAIAATWLVRPDASGGVQTGGPSAWQ